MSEIKLVCGLGNPGDKYSNTRHNIGFMVIDRLLNAKSLSHKEGFKSQYALFKSDQSTVIFQKPMTYMNLSGESVGEVARYYKIFHENILILQDDVHLVFGKLKFIRNSSSGGHNGIKSITNHLGSQSYARLKIGVSSPSRHSLVDYVLSGFDSDEKQQLDQVIDESAEAVEYYLAHGLTKAMSIYNRRKD